MNVDMDNPIKRAIREGGKVRGFHLTFPCPALIELLLGQGLDFIYFDGEHGPFAPREIEECCRAAEWAGLTPIARVPDISEGTINLFLDRGIRGIVGPHIASRKEAEALVRACYFAPLGERSWGESRGERYGIDIGDTTACMAALNANISVGVMIEDIRALDALDDILTVEGIDYINLGLNDMAQSLGHPGKPTHPDVRAAHEEVARRVHAAGKLMREDFMIFAWARDVIHAGLRATITDV